MIKKKKLFKYKRKKIKLIFKKKPKKGGNPARERKKINKINLKKKKFWNKDKTLKNKFFWKKNVKRIVKIILREFI